MTSATTSASGRTSHGRPPSDADAEADGGADAVGAVAAAAAAAAGVTVRTVDDVAGVRAVADFFADVWQLPRSVPPYPSEVLHSLVHAGGAVHAAYSAGPEGERPAGGAVAVFGPPAAQDVYSFVAAATASDRGVGFAVKQAQRVWALAHGARTMRWTFDPLVCRNARFNLVKLGAVGAEYLVDLYGPMNDGVNDGDESDRLTAEWDLRTATTRTADPAEGRSAATVAGRAPDGGLLAARDDRRRRLWCRVPEDIVALRSADPALALRWRYAVREVFTEAYAEGFRATAMSRDGWYLLTHDSSETPDSRDSPEDGQA